MKKILVTGAQGQLGQCLQDIAEAYENLEFIFVSREQLDITNENAVTSFFEDNAFEYCINTAAYTQVDQAEKDEALAFNINAEAVKNLAVVCAALKIKLVHVSTDYVFDGTKTSPYVEEDATNPIGVYGASKLKGEQYIQEICEHYYIVRTSWLYSQFGNNFFKFILKHGAAGTPLNITTEQVGTPTNANDLARFLLEIISEEKEEYGLYHYANTGTGTWYDFAAEIIEKANLLSSSNLDKTDHYPTFAKRPAYSVMSTKKAELKLGSKTIHWRESLEQLINTTNSNN